MLQVNGITTDSLQEQTLLLPDGTGIVMTLYFMPMQYCWLIQSLVYGDFQLNGLRICNNPNMLRQFINQIPFGLACYTTGNREPTQQQDFQSGNSILYLLTADEVAQYEEFLSGKVLS